MKTSSTQLTAAAAAFFCLMGWVCSGSAIGDDLPETGFGEPVELIAETPEPTAETPLAAVETPVAAVETVQPVSVTNYDTVSLNVQNTDLSSVLQLLSVQGRRNIVPSPKVQGSVTANLYDVTFYEALDAILQQNGCGYKETGSFIYVYTIEELQQTADQERQVEVRIFRLNYIPATEAATFVKELLSSAGSIAVSAESAAGYETSTSDGGADSWAHTPTLVVYDYAENIERIAQVVEQLDVRPRQVLVEATILKAELTENLAFGVDLSILADAAFDTFVNPLSVVDGLISGAVHDDSVLAMQHTSGNVAKQKTGLKIGIVTDNIAAFIRALDGVTDTVVLANPKLLVLNRQRADVLVGQKVGYLSTEATSTASTQTVEFLDTGTQLTVRPYISDEGWIRLELKPQISSATFRESGGFSIPDETTQELTTNIQVKDGQTVVLGGLFKEETTINRSQVPYLGDIPIAGYAFKDRDDLFVRNEYIFLVTPHIVKDTALAKAGESLADTLEMVSIGARDGLLPFSRDKLTASHLREALRYIEKNDHDNALWEVDLALGLDPHQPDALRLKEKLTGGRMYWHTDGMLDDAVEVMVEQQTGQRKGRARPMTPSPRQADPVSDGEALSWSTQESQPTDPAATEAQVELSSITPAEEPGQDAEAGESVDQPLIIQTSAEPTELTGDNEEEVWESEAGAEQSEATATEPVETAQDDTGVAADNQSDNGSIGPAGEGESTTAEAPTGEPGVSAQSSTSGPDASPEQEGAFFGRIGNVFEPMQGVDPDPQGRFDSYDQWAEAEPSGGQGADEAGEPADGETADDESATAGVDADSLDQVMEDFGVSE